MLKKIRDKILGQKPVYRTLELPITLRVPLPNEVPMDDTVLANIKRSETANIVEGYTLKLKDDNPEHSNLEFEIYSEINIDNSRLWKLFIELTNLLPEEVTLISGHITVLPNFRTASWLISDRELTINKKKPQSFFLLIVG